MNSGEPAAPLLVLPEKYVAAENQIRLGQAEESTHGLQVLMGLTNEMLGPTFILTPNEIFLP